MNESIKVVLHRNIVEKEVLWQEADFEQYLKKIRHFLSNGECMIEEIFRDMDDSRKKWKAFQTAKAIINPDMFDNISFFCAVKNLSWSEIVKEVREYKTDGTFHISYWTLPDCGRESFVKVSIVPKLIELMKTDYKGCNTKKGPLVEEIWINSGEEE